MKSVSFNVKGPVWLYPGSSGWHFFTINKELSDEIKRFDSLPRRGFGSIPVNAIIGETKWKTSIFPEKKGTFVLPLKKAVRKAENIKDGDKIKVILEVIR